MSAVCRTEFANCHLGGAVAAQMGAEEEGGVLITVAAAVTRGSSQRPTLSFLLGKASIMPSNITSASQLYRRRSHFLRPHIQFVHEIVTKKNNIPTRFPSQLLQTAQKREIILIILLHDLALPLINCAKTDGGGPLRGYLSIGIHLRALQRAVHECLLIY